MSGYLKRGTDPFPVHRLKRIERPTTLILDDKVQRFDERESGFKKMHIEGIMVKNFTEKGGDSFLNILPLLHSNG